MRKTKIRQVYRKTLPVPVRDFLWRFRKFLSYWGGGKYKPEKTLRLEIHLTDHCNLNCANCSHFSPVADEYYLDIESYKNDCARISGLGLDRIGGIRLMGGEPLLHPQLIEILKISRQFFNGDNYVEIVTNGILLPKQSAEFWQVCKENRIRVFISKYPIKLDMELIEKTAKQFSVDIILSDKESDWRVKPLDLTGSQNKKRSFILCNEGEKCIQLEEGKLFTCAQTAYIRHFNKYFGTNLEVTEDDYISVYEKHTIDEILRFLSKPKPFCRYCIIGYGGGKFCRPWEMSHKSITEWT